MAKSFHDLEVWRCSMDLAEVVYGATSAFPKHETYGLASQMRRAAVSIPSNIAEGSARGTKKDFRQFVLTARGSNAELQTQLLLAHRLGYVTEPQFEDAIQRCQQVGRMLSGLSDYLQQATPHSPRT